MPFARWTRRLDPESNSLVTLMLHLSGNMLSRWTDFLTTDGEKPTRHRDAEFEDAAGLSRDALLERWSKGWECLYAALSSLTAADLERTVVIRAQPHSVVQALNRQIAHYAYHAGQMVFLAKHLSGPGWRTLSVPRGASETFNAAKTREYRRDYRIRLAPASDVASLPGIERAAAQLYLPYAEALGLTTAMLDRTNSASDFARARKAGLLWVATTADDAPVGFALLMELDACIHLDELGVHPAHGRRGLGSLLLKAACEWAVAATWPGVTLSTYREVPWNAPFYARRGFRALAETELTPGLADLRDGERERGLRTDLRVIMRYDCGAASPPS